MRAALSFTDAMTARDFFAFTDTRPDEEKWELLDGIPEMNAAPSFLHQTILGNLFASLRRSEKQQVRSWVTVLGFGLRVTDRNVPVPDLLVRPNTTLVGRECDDAIVAVEILSPSTAHKDRRVKRALYANLPSLQQYVIVAQDDLAVLSYERHEGFTEKQISGLGVTLVMPALAAELSLADIYEGTGL